MSAFWFSPAARSCAISSALLTPAGSCLETTPGEDQVGALAQQPRPDHRQRHAGHAHAPAPAAATPAPAAACPAAAWPTARSSSPSPPGRSSRANGPPRPGPPAGRGMRTTSAVPVFEAGAVPPGPAAWLAPDGGRCGVLIPSPPLPAGRRQSPGTSPTSPAARCAFRAPRSCRRRAPGSGPRPRCWTRAGR